MIANIGRFIGFIIIAFFVKLSAGKVISYYNGMALLYLFGGVLFTLSIVTSPVVFFKTITSLITDNKHLSVNYRHRIIDKLVNYSKDFYTFSEEVQARIRNEKNQFLQESLAKVLDGLQTPEEIELILLKKSQFNYEKKQHKIDLLYSFVKYPPIVGIFGTLIGVMAYVNYSEVLNTYLGSPGEIIEFSILVTLYSFAFTYLILLPAVERIEQINQNEFLNARLVTEGSVLIAKKLNPIIVREVLENYIESSADNDEVNIESMVNEVENL